MNLNELEQERMDLEKQLTKIKQKHEKDPDLDHTIGMDDLCLFCDQYKVVQKKLKIIYSRISKNKRNKEALQRKSKKEKNIEITVPFKDPTVKHRKPKVLKVFQVTTNEYDEFLIAVYKKEEVYNFVPVLTIKKITEIPEKYWEQTFVETDNGSLMAVSSIVPYLGTTRIVSKKAQSVNRYRRRCYNEQPLEFLIYSPERFEELQKFAAPFEVSKTKKFNSQGRVAVNLPTGMTALVPDTILLKLTARTFVAMEQEEFYAYFQEEENLVWGQFKEGDSIK